MPRTSKFLALGGVSLLLAGACAPMYGQNRTVAPPSATPAINKPLVQGFAKQRIQDKLNRGVLAMPTSNGRVYVGWRLLDSDPADVAFHVYRRGGNAQPTRLTSDPVRKTTDFVDNKPEQGAQEYFIRPIINGQEGQPSESAVATASPDPKPCISIKLQGDYTYQKVAVADLDGDGHYDFVVKQPGSNVDPYGPYWKKSETTYKLEAYRHDGTFLWRYDMGWAIEAGIWYSPYVVYDFDGDGKAEVAVKTGEGDPRDADGRVKTGPEYLSILDGQTGKLRARIDWPSRDGFPDYNYYCRNQLGIAYLDGKTPCLLVNRGTYNTIKVAAYDFNNNTLRKLWDWTDTEDGPAYRGQGAHTLKAADIDGDGRDEVLLGSAVIDDNGKGLWSTSLGHPDHMTVGDLDPNHPGLEIHYGLERAMKKNGICMVDAKTGKLLWSLDEPTKHVHGQGLCADIDPANPGCECYGGERDFKEKRWLFSATGKLLATKDLGGLAPRAAYWDADYQREIVPKNKRPRKFDGSEVGPKLEGEIIAVADILGDWREEVITSVGGELRIYTTTIPAADRRHCLLLDPIYRLDVSGFSQGYFQIPGLQTLPGTEKK